jgi:hypothetical protein
MNPDTGADEIGTAPGQRDRIAGRLKIASHPDHDEANDAGGDGAIDDRIGALREVTGVEVTVCVDEGERQGRH